MVHTHTITNNSVDLLNFHGRGIFVVNNDVGIHIISPNTYSFIFFKKC